MPRSRDTVYANMSFNARDPQVQAAVDQAEASDIALGTYLKKLVLALLAQGPLLLLQFREMSRVRVHLLQEAREVEMSLDTYVLALLADRDRSLYEASRRPTSLWYPRGLAFVTDVVPVGGDEEEVEPEDDVNIEEAMANANDFLAELSGF
jgi:hypothetical protein